MNPKISACLLVRDDASTLVECLESIKPHVDELCILDTGSIDDSPAIAQKYADKWERWTGCNDEAGLIADFAAARNKSYELASHDWVFWADADDVFVGAEHLRELVARKPTDNVLYLFPYEYQHDAQGRVTVLHYRENLVYPRPSYRWRVPVHEVLVPEGPIAGSAMTAYVHDILPGRDIRRVHRKQHSKKPPDPMRNWRILDRYVRANGEGDIRALYYLGVECSVLGMLGQALSNLRRYIQLTDSPSGWTDERCLATLEIARIHERMGDWEQAIEWGLKAMATKSWCEPYFVIARGCLALAELGKNVTHNHKRAAHFAQLGLRLAATKTVLFVNPMDRFEIHRVLNVALYKLGDIPGALQSCKDGLEGLPGDPELTNNMAVFEGAVTRNRVLADLTRLHAINQLAPDFCNALAGRLTQVAAQMTAPAAPAGLPAPGPMPPNPVPEQTAAEGCLDIALFVGPQYEPWSPETLAKTGMGGSEVMAWEMSKRLRGLGHRVRVFGHCNAEHEGLYEGVEWLAWERFQGTACDVLITSRRPEAVDPGVCEAKVRILWVHDVHVGDALDYRRALRIDRIFALTDWHKSLLLHVYGGLDPASVVVTRNGIDYGRFRAGASLPMPYLPGGQLPDAPLPVTGEHIPRYEIPASGIVVGGAVASADDWAALEALGVTHCLSVTDPPDVGVPVERLLHLPVPDEGAPFPVENLEKVVAFARTALGGGKLYVHCWVGRSRSPSHAYAILRAVYGLGRDEAIGAIREHSPWQPPFGSESNQVAYLAGIDAWLATHGQRPERHPHRLVYSSSPDRGLHILLDLWPQIRREIPDAELVVLYGWDNWEKAAAARNDPQELAQMARIKAGLQQEGVVARGRVNPAELTIEFLSAGVWAYPTWFSETSCITAMEAMAAGLHIVATPVAALNETLLPPAVLVPGVVEDPYAQQTPEFLAEFYHATIQAMRRAEVGPAEYPQRYGLDELAKEWDAMLRELVETVPGQVPRWVA